MGLRNLKEMLSQERASEILAKRELETIFSENIILQLARLFMKRYLIKVAMAVGNTWKNQLRLISAGIQMQSFIHMQKKTGGQVLVGETALLSRDPLWKLWNITRIKVYFFYMYKMPLCYIQHFVWEIFVARRICILSGAGSLLWELSSFMGSK